MNSLTFEANVTVDHRLPLPSDLPVGTLVRVTVEPLDAERTSST